MSGLAKNCLIQIYQYKYQHKLTIVQITDVELDALRLSTASTALSSTGHAIVLGLGVPSIIFGGRTARVVLIVGGWGIVTSAVAGGGA